MENGHVENRSRHLVFPQQHMFYELRHSHSTSHNIFMCDPEISQKIHYYYVIHKVDVFDKEDERRVQELDHFLDFNNMSMSCNSKVDRFILHKEPTVRRYFKVKN